MTVSRQADSIRTRRDETENRNDEHKPKVPLPARRGTFCDAQASGNVGKIGAGVKKRGGSRWLALTATGTTSRQHSPMVPTALYANFLVCWVLVCSRHSEDRSIMVSIFSRRTAKGNVPASTWPVEYLAPDTRLCQAVSHLDRSISRCSIHLQAHSSQDERFPTGRQRVPRPSILADRIKSLQLMFSVCRQEWPIPTTLSPCSGPARTDVCQVHRMDSDPGPSCHGYRCRVWTPSSARLLEGSLLWTWRSIYHRSQLRVSTSAEVNP
jgi:hypothetical protein